MAAFMSSWGMSDEDARSMLTWSRVEVEEEDSAVVVVVPPVTATDGRTVGRVAEGGGTLLVLPEKDAPASWVSSKSAAVSS